jgi:hypothetical protein
MAASIFNGDLRKVDPPLAWEPVRVPDPRYPDCTTMIMLLTREVLVPGRRQDVDLAGNLLPSTYKVLISPLIPNAGDQTVWEILTFQVVDPRFPSTTVQVGLLPQEAWAYRRSIAFTTSTTGQQETMNEDKVFRYRCNKRQCRTTSTEISEIMAHHGANHPESVFDLNKVLVYEVDGPDDRKFSKFSDLPSL